MMSPTGPEPPPLLRIAALTKRFGGFTALDNISVDIRPGERFGLIGPNGSGKTTLINCISGAFRTEVGTVVFRGEDVTRLPPHMRTRRGIARSFQIPRPFKSMTVAENLMVAIDFATAVDEFVPVAQRRAVSQPPAVQERSVAGEPIVHDGPQACDTLQDDVHAGHQAVPAEAHIC